MPNESRQAGILSNLALGEFHALRVHPRTKRPCDLIDSACVENGIPRPDHFVVQMGPDARLVECWDEDATFEIKIVNSRGDEIDQNSSEDERDGVYIIGRIP